MCLHWERRRNGRYRFCFFAPSYGLLSRAVVLTPDPVLGEVTHAERITNTNPDNTTEEPLRAQGLQNLTQQSHAITQLYPDDQMVKESLLLFQSQSQSQSSSSHRATLNSETLVTWQATVRVVKKIKYKTARRDLYIYIYIYIYIGNIQSMHIYIHT